MEGMEHAPQVPGYEVLGPLGQGASATVWRARRLGDGLVVALKVLTPAGGDVTEGLREAGLLAGVRHRHVVRLYDVLPLPDPATGRPVAVALATQLAGGGSLGQVLTRRRILSAGELVTALQPVAGALADLHAQGVVHGDLSTGNVLFLRDGMPLLADLGAARITGAPAGDPQGTGVRSGLVAPEVVEGFSPTQESDVYQLGAVAWLCLAGEPPGPPWSRGTLEELAPGLPAGLTDLVTQCLAPEPGDRPDAEEVALGLLAVATPEPVEVAPDADSGHDLTERLRRQAHEDLGPESQELSRPRWRAPWRRSRPDAGAAARGRPPTGRSARSGTHRRKRLREGAASPDRARLFAAAVVAVVLVLGAVVAGTRLGPGVLDLARAGSGESPSAVPSPPPSMAPPSMAPPSATEDEAVTGVAGAAADAEAPPSPTRSPLPEQGPVDLAPALQGLVDGRAEAWRTGDPALLDGVVADGSPALDTETAALADARDQGVRYPDVRFRVEAAEVVGQDDARLTVDALVLRDGLRAVGSDGGTVAEHPATTDDVRLVLTREGDAEPWRLWSWGPG
ncbi:serine/threonine-protein kinase [Ornithinimicrobium pekingense]|nr:serine/threonine-protein kinase [Ornithinimicrobium pekingense]